jgi:DNA-directed RNA polymerase
MTSKTQADPIQHQIEREVGMLMEGRERALRRDQAAAKAGEQTRTERLTLEHLLPAVRGFLQAQLEAYPTGRKPAWFNIIEGMDLDEVAATALRGTFAGAMKTAERTAALKAIGRNLEVLYVFGGLRAEAEAQSRRAQMKVRTLVKGKGTQAARRKAVMATAQADEWDEEALLQNAAPLLSAAMATGLFEVVSVPVKGGKGGPKDSREVLQLSDEGQAMAREVDELGLLALPLYRPMLTKPRDWEGLDTGAYVTDAVRQGVKLVRTSDKAQKGLLERGIKDGSMRPVLEATTTLQSVPMMINTDVLELREWVSVTRFAIKDATPRRDPVTVPGIGADGKYHIPACLQFCVKKEQRVWWAQRTRAIRTNAGIGPNVLAWNAVANEARSLASDEGNRFYLPHNMDFRGREYPIPFLNHHAGDATKAMLSFARGVALGEDGLFWLKVHVANTGDFGKISKKSFDARVAWADANLEDIKRVASEPHIFHLWANADKPFSFYAACRELAAALTLPDPSTFVSHLPIAMDGSNSGVQHFSAMMRAEEGHFVNLTPEAAPQDLYAVVAAEVAGRVQKASRMVAKALAGAGRAYPSLEELITHQDDLNDQIEELEAPFKEAELRLDVPTSRKVSRLKARRNLTSALLWAAEGVSRSTVKRGVMTFGYSSVAFGMAQQIREDYMEPLAMRVLSGDLARHPFGADEGKAAAGWMGKAIYASVVRVLPRVASAMAWLRTAAAVLAHEGKGVLMITPLGFPMLMKVTEWEEKRVELLLLDRAVPVREAVAGRDKVIGESVLKRTRVTLRAASGAIIVKHKQQAGVAPNTIHAMDACHLQKVALRMKDLGVPDILVIHDSFATHAANVGTMKGVLTEQLVDLYENFDPLEDIQARALKVLSPENAEKMPPLPEKGTLDLGGILEGLYAFA